VPDTSLFTMPSLGADMDAGTLLEWLVKPGDTVHKGDIVAVVDTTKAAVEVETFQDGVVDALLVPEGSEVPVGTPLASIRAGAAAAPPATRKPAQPAPEREPTPAAAPPSREAATHVTSPLVRRRAAELGIDLDRVVGTGRGGVVTRADVERLASPRETVGPPAARRQATPYARRLAAEHGVDLATLPATSGPVRAADVRRAATHAGRPTHPGAATHAGRASPPSRATDMRTAIARLMARSKREIPHYYLSTTVDLQASMTWMHEQNRGLPVTRRLVPAALLLKATALAAQRHPELNGFWVDDRFVAGPAVHLGIAISLREGGLVAPALHDAAGLAVPELMERLRDLVTRARAGRLRGSEMSDPTLTVTNLGDQGVESVLGVIYPPQVALVGYGRVGEQVRAVDGLIGVRPTTVVTLAADHRATDGFTGARFLDTIDRLLQEPEGL
jgi:pyruvate dehydrogenase E2 component (dihydrolipoamide acetyltransferase)